MPELSTPTTKILVRSTDYPLTDEVRARAEEDAARLLRDNRQIKEILLTLERSTTGDAVLAKGEVNFDGPALFTSVTAATAAEALAYLIERMGHQLRRHRVHSGRASPPRAPAVRA